MNRRQHYKSNHINVFCGGYRFIHFLAFIKKMPYRLYVAFRSVLLDEELVRVKGKVVMNNRVFIVHGHDNYAKEVVARFIEKMGFEAVILHEQADEGRTIIEKIEWYSDVSFAIVLYTECDVGRDKNKDEGSNKYRARQNVVFEHGYLIGKLGRNKVCTLIKGDVETPGDISGVVYIPLDEDGLWKTSLCKNMKAVGLNIDTNKLI